MWSVSSEEALPGGTSSPSISLNPKGRGPYCANTVTYLPSYTGCNKPHVCVFLNAFLLVQTLITDSNVFSGTNFERI